MAHCRAPPSGFPSLPHPTHSPRFTLFCMFFVSPFSLSCFLSVSDLIFLSIHQY